MSNEKAKWYSHWYSGELRQCDYIWGRWYSLVTGFGLEFGLQITHFGGRSPEFKSGKYLEYQRGRNQLERALHKRVEFQHLSFIEMNGPFRTLAAECSFSASLGPHGVEVDIRLDQHDEAFCISFGNLAAELFQGGRLISFKTRGDRGNLPVNFVGNYGKKHFIPGEHHMAADYFDIKATLLDSDVRPAQGVAP